MVAYLVKPSTEKEGRCRFARHPVAVAYSGRAHAMMSHYWDGSWGTLIAAAAQGANMGRFIWICALANRCGLFGVLYMWRCFFLINFFFDEASFLVCV